MQNLLITGGCGFIGSNFVRFMLGRDDFTGRIINVDCLTYAANPKSLTDIENDFPDRYVFIRADICDGPQMAEIFDRYGVDAICHFAAESHVDRSIVNPGAFIQTNIVGTFNLLELARF
ncbi:MAG: GDP-mannose 4,6-dehydratase, partial [Deltaproteobacteria bacterium]|nr:GDP-mannose 4,6-dehydratase [Deltaproteobacteria bacterium]